jgi:hypothetical protein
MRNKIPNSDIIGYEGPVGHEKAIHKNTFEGVDTSHFKVWVLKRGKIVRTTKAQAKEKGYKIIASTRKRPKLEIQNGTATPNSSDSNNR